MDSGRTVVDNLLRRKTAQRVAVVDYPWSDSLLQWIAQGYPTRMVYKEVGTKRWRPEDGQTVDVEVAGEYVEPVPPWEYFGHDMASVGGWFDLHPLRGYSEVLEETDEWEVKRNGSGAALKYWKHHMGTPEHMDFRMTSRRFGSGIIGRTCWRSMSSAWATWRKPKGTWPRRGRWAAGRTWATCSSGRGCGRAWATWPCTPA